MSKWIKKGDKVIVISGNEKGKIAEVMLKLKDKVVLKGLNIRKKHVKKSQTAAQQIIDIEMPIHISNVALLSRQDKPVRPKVKITKKSKELVYYDGDKEVVLREIKKVK